jgi:hypothetical protein
VTDAMATGGSDITSFTLNDREILRRDGRLTLADGTLAGADLTLLQAVRYMHNTVGEPLERALARATAIPAQLLAHPPEADSVDAMIWINDDLSKGGPDLPAPPYIFYVSHASRNAPMIWSNASRALARISSSVAS